MKQTRTIVNSRKEKAVSEPPRYIESIFQITLNSPKTQVAEWSLFEEPEHQQIG